MEKLTPEEMLLNAIFNDEDDEFDEKYPDTNAEKISYAMYALTKSLEYTSAALIRLQRLDTLLTHSMPDVIINNEVRMALNYLMRVCGNVEDAFSEVSEVYNRTRENNTNEHN